MNPSDLDTLADYIEGLLDGTPAAETVAERIASDPTWADAYQQLTVATPQVTVALSGLADPPLPPAVLAQLEERLEVAYDARPPSRRRPHLNVSAGWAAAAALVLVAFLGGGLAVLRSGGSSGTGSASDDSAASAPERATIAAAAGVHRSGLDYTEQNLGPQARDLLNQPLVASSSQAPAPVPPHELGRLQEPAALRGCLTALKVDSVLAVDYASFDGRPAVVIVTSPRPGDLLVLAAGTGCGVGGDPALLAQADVEQ